MTLRLGWLWAALLAFIIYIPALSFDFTIDDLDIVLDNPRIRDLGDPAAYLGTSWWDRPNLHKEYRPATMASFALNYAAGEVNPFGYHLVNNLLHAVNAILVWLLVWQFARHHARRGVLALLASGLFAIHPVHIEAVAGIVGRAEELVTAGYLLALVASLASMRAAAPRLRWLLAAAALGATLLATFSKEHGVTLPAAVVLLALIVCRPEASATAGFAPRIVGARVLPAIALTTLGVVIYFVVRTGVLGSLIRPEDSPIIPTANPLVMLDPMRQKIGALAVLARIWGLFLLPFWPSSDYSYRALDPVALGAGPLALAGAAGLIAAITGMVFWRSRPEARLGLALILAPLPVYSSVVINIGTILGERLLYLPSAGICIVAASLAADPRRGKRFRPAIFALFGLWMAALLAQHFRYLPTWRNPRSVLDYSIVRVPDCSNVQFGYALELYWENRIDEALEHLNRAHAIWPYEPSTIGWRGIMLAQLRRDDEALPDLQAFRREFPNWALANEALITILADRGQWEEADRVILEALASDPGSAESRELLERWQESTGRLAGH